MVEFQRHAGLRLQALCFRPFVLVYFFPEETLQILEIIFSRNYSGQQQL